MSETNMEINYGGIEGGLGDALGGSGGTNGGDGGLGPVAPNESLPKPGAAHAGLDDLDTSVQVNSILSVCCGRSKNANYGGTGPDSNTTSADISFSNGDTSILDKTNLSRIDDFNSTNDDAESVSLNSTGFDNSNINYADITYVSMPDDFQCINLNETNVFVKENREKETEKEKNRTEEDPKKKRLSNSERRWRKKCKLDEEKGKEFREKNKDKPMSDLQKKVNEAYKKKLSYAQCTKTHEMLEVRSTDLDVMLDQPDFDKIDRELLYMYAGLEINDDPSNVDEDERSEDEDDDENNGKNKFFYGLVGGISQGCCWLACDNADTVAFVKQNVPLILPPSPFTDKYKYMVYSASQKPFRYMKCKIPKKMWDTKKRLQALFKATNPCLNMKVPDETNPGKNRQVRFKIVAGCHDYEAEIIMNKFFWIQVEVDEKLMPILTGNEHRGALKLGASPINLIGGGIVSETKKQIERELTQQPEDLILNLSASVDEHRG